MGAGAGARAGCGGCGGWGEDKADGALGDCVDATLEEGAGGAEGLDFEAEENKGFAHALPLATSCSPGTGVSDTSATTGVARVCGGCGCGC